MLSYRRLEARTRPQPAPTDAHILRSRFVPCPLSFAALFSSHLTLTLLSYPAPSPRSLTPPFHPLRPPSSHPLISTSILTLASHPA
eukprot:2418207-Pleurochrysis_carterae.AAC.5